MKFLKKYRWILWILLIICISVFLRLFIYLQIMNTTPYHDYFAYKQWIYNSYSHGLNNLYSLNETNPTTEIDINQPPGSILILRGSYEVFLQTAKVLTRALHLKEGGTLWINDNLLIFFFRAPSILADLILGLLIYLTVKIKAKEKTAIAAASLYLLSPPIIYNSTVLGQMDSINNLLFYISVFFLIKKKAFFSVLFLALSLFVKLSLLPLVPIYLLFALFGGFFRRSSFILSSIASLLIILLLSFPFFTNPLWLFDFLMSASAGQSQDITVNAYNFWWLIFNPAPRTNPPDTAAVFFGLNLSMWGSTLLAIFYLPLLLALWRRIKEKKLSTDTVFLSFAVIAFAAFLFLPKMHERYLYPALPLLITWVGLKNKYWLPCIILLLLHFFNLYTVWNPNLFLFGPLENTMSSQLSKWLLSLTTIVIFGFFYLQIYQHVKSYIKFKKS